MNWQRDIAQQIVLPIYQQLDGLICFLLVGSASRNLQNAQSDVDAVIYWYDVPSEFQRVHAIEKAGGTVHEIGDSSEGETDPALQSQAEVFYLFGDRLSGVKIDVTHKTESSAKSLIRSVVQAYDNKRIKLAIIHGLRHSLALYGGDWMNEQRAAIGDQLPMPIAEKLIAMHGQFKPVWIYDMLADRPDPILYQMVRLEHIENMLMTLAAINRVYMPYDFKHLAAFIDELTIKPNLLWQDINIILNSPPPQAKRLILNLGDTIHDQLEKHFPHIDIQVAREWFHYARPKHEQSPLKEITQ